MRILAIRGCNLASLAGEFEIDLARAPFSDAGVFAIVGNTGAGKSTLLDALCVALFDRTPRLTNHSRVVVGRGEGDPGALGAQDVRTLLRRGAAAGWAEVDFEAGDARRYRARWSVRRARGQTDGTLQDQQVTLTSLDGGERLGGTKTETLKAIVARLGLTFDQFRRSALLAQGEFAAFLRADGKDRSELLERMTGTEIYSRLSIAAHVRASLAEQRLRDGRAKADAIPVLAEDVRAATEAELAVAEAAKLATRARLAAAETNVRWYAERRGLRRALHEAAQAHAAALAAVAAAEVDRAELALRRRAEQLRGVWDEAARLDRELAVARGEADALAIAVAAARSTHADVLAQRDAIATLHAPIRAACSALGLGSSAPRVAPAHRASPSPRAALSAAEQAQVREDAAWLVARAALAPEIAAWPELDARFAQHGALLDAIASIDRTARDHGASRTQLCKARDAVAADHASAVHKLGEAQRKAASYHARRGLTLDAARRQEDEARARLADVERLVSIAAGAREAQRLREHVDQQLADLEEQAAADAAQRTRLDADRTHSLVLRSERARIVDELRRAAGYEHARAELREGEPCPLCGALEHPWNTLGTFDEVIRVEEQRLAETTAALDATHAALAALTARAHERTKDRERLVRHRDTALSSTASDATRWREQLCALGELLLETNPATLEAQRIAAELDASARARLEQARAVFSQTQAATKAAQDAQAEMQLAQAAVDHAHALVVDHDRRIAELEATVQRLAGERATRAERSLELESELTAAVARWRGALELADAPAVHDASRAPASAPHVSRAAGARRVRPVVSIPSDLVAARGAMSEVVAAWCSRADRIARADAALAADIVAAEREERDAERAVAEHAARHEATCRRRDALAAELAVAAERLDAARVAARFETEELRRLLAASASRADELAETLSALDRTVDRTRAVVVERRTRFDAHAATRPPELAAPGAKAATAAADDDIASTSTSEHAIDGSEHAIEASEHAIEEAWIARRDELESAVVAADHHAARLVAALAADADARARRQAALAAIAEAESSVEVDRVLGEVIGSHDGKLFRSFAQSLTLDSLLAVANAHLEELAPRYQLERVPRHDLELQVIDRDLGAEVRSVQSLSGGESFLVSLALALGLSSMSAHDVRVRTLLIDEGFGTLDPATLDGALSVLDALQATGRQVGVISHVPALVERVGAHVRVVQRGGGRSEVVVA